MWKGEQFPEHNFSYPQEELVQRRVYIYIYSSFKKENINQEPQGGEGEGETKGEGSGYEERGFRVGGMCFQVWIDVCLSHFLL